MEIDLQRAIERELKGPILCLTHRLSTSTPSRIASNPTSISAFATLYQIDSSPEKTEIRVKISDQAILSIIIEGLKAAVHWRATIHSRVTGTTVETELVDLVEARDEHIASYIEFFVPRHRR